MDYLLDLGLFLKECLLQWVNLVGGFVGIVWGFYERKRGKDVSVKTFFVIVGACLAFAAFQAWREQYLIASPQLRGYIAKMGAASESEDSNTVTVFVLLSITNPPTGHPTIVDMTTATIKFGKTTLNVPYCAFAKEVSFSFNNNSKRATLKNADMIHNKLNKPIQPGDRVTGFEVYCLDGVTLSQLRDNGFETTVHFKDAVRNECSAKFALTAETPRGPWYVPGVNDPFLPIEEEEFPDPSLAPPSPASNTEASPP